MTAVVLTTWAEDSLARKIASAVKGGAPDQRTILAGMAMQGLLSACNGWCGPTDAKEIAMRSRVFADALLVELANPSAEG